MGARRRADGRFHARNVLHPADRRRSPARVHQGDIREAYVIGSLWNTTDRPPALTQLDATVKRIIRTPTGHELEFDETLGTVKITNFMRHSITLSPTGIELSTIGGLSKLTLGTDGSISLIGSLSVSVSALDVAVSGATGTTLSGGTVTVDGGANCTIRGATVNIN